MKKLFTLLLFSVVCMTPFAQEKVTENPPISRLVLDNYERNSLSLIVIDRCDARDEEVARAVASINMGGKFDINRIPTTRIACRSNRHEGAVSETTVATALDRRGIAKEVVSYWYMRTDDGLMSADRLMNRGLYNAGDEEVDIAAMSAVGSDNAMELLGSVGDTLLLDNSYVMVLDISKITRSVTTGNDEQWSVTTTAYVYKLADSDDVRDAVYDVWVDEYTKAETREKLADKYDDLEFSMTHCATVDCVTVKKQEDGGISQAIVESYEEVMTSLENHINTWNVTAHVVDVKPIRAAVGLKEGLKNGKRYKTYEIVADRKGNKESKGRGYVRATTVGDNRQVARGSGLSVMSEFYQISGVRSVKPNYLLRQSNDLGMGVGLGYKMGVFGGVNVTLDYLTKIRTSGSATYALLDVAIDATSGSNSVLDGTALSSGAMFSYIAAGMGWSIRPIRPLELMGYFMVGIDCMSLMSEDTSSNDVGSMDYAAYTGALGGRANFTIAYPFMLFADVNYTLLVSKGDRYAYYNDYLRLAGDARKSGFSFSLGAKYIF